jgi:hypothetical protein
MKTLLFFATVAFSFNVYSQSSVKIGKLEIMTNDLGRMTWGEAKSACIELGGGWRLPNKEELNIIFENKDKIGQFGDLGYWSGTTYGNGGAWVQSMKDGFQFFNEWNWPFLVRLVRDI